MHNSMRGSHVHLFKDYCTRLPDEPQITLERMNGYVEDKTLIEEAGRFGRSGYLAAGVDPERLCRVAGQGIKGYEYVRPRGCDLRADQRHHESHRQPDRTAANKPLHAHGMLFVGKTALTRSFPDGRQLGPWL